MFSKAKAGGSSSVKGKKINKPVFAGLMESLNPIPNSSVVARKKCIEDVGGLSEDPAIVTVEDFDLWLRIARNTERFHYIPQVLGLYWFGENRDRYFSDVTISRIEKVYKRYYKFLSERDIEDSKRIMSYALGRIQQERGAFSEAKRFFINSAKSADIEIKLKSILRLFQGYFHNIVFS